MPTISMLLCLLLSPHLLAGTGKLQETAGVTQIEGSSGGGLVPWATLSGYDTQDEWSASAFTTRASFDNYRLQAFGASISFNDSVELSVAEHIFELKAVPFGEREIKQQILGIKYKLMGDFIYTPYPQISIGVQHKTLQDDLIATALGADETDKGLDLYIAISKAHLGLLSGYNAFWNFTVRASKANQFGLLGFGGDNNNSYVPLIEGSAGLLLSRKIAIGAEYRQKPDNLSSVNEEDAYDIFVAYIPNKFFNITTAWVNLGEVAGAKNQSGFYVSLTGYLW